MSREIKFRTWKMHNGKMSRCIYTPVSIMHYAQTHLDEPVVKHSGENNIRNFMPDADIIEQYTGLKDRNGKEIYEGDIMSDGSIVRYSNDEDEVGSCGCCVPEFWGAGFIVSNNNRPSSLAVIGNIHENPEFVRR